MQTPSFDYSLDFQQRLKLSFSLQTLIAEFVMETFNTTAFHGCPDAIKIRQPLFCSDQVYTDCTVNSLPLAKRRKAGAGLFLRWADASAEDIG